MQLIATFIFGEKIINVYGLQQGGFLLMPSWIQATSFAMYFRGGTDRFCSLTLDYLRNRISKLSLELNVAMLCPEYGDSDMHGGESDLNLCDKALQEFEEAFPHLAHVGSWGESRGCMEAWQFHLRHSQFTASPLAMWSPVFDYESLLKERPEMKELFDEKGISDLKSRSAKERIAEISNCASRFLIIGASDDVRAPVHHAIDFADALKEKCQLFVYSGPHCLINSEHAKDAMKQTIRLFLPS